MRWTLQDLLVFGGKELTEKGIPEPETDARYLLLEAFRTDMAHFLLDRNRELPDTDGTREMAVLYREMIGRRAKRVPLQQILGVQEFMGMGFLVNRHVLIPRQDTETLVELVIKEHPGAGEEILDLCTGSGCIAISLAALGRYGQVTAVDLSREALKVAEKNCRKLLGRERLLEDGRQGIWDKEQCSVPEEGRWGVPGKEQRGIPEAGRRGTSGKGCQVRLLEGDLFRALDPGTPKFDIIVSNPPYIPTQVIEGLEPEVRDFEPRMALDGSRDGLEFYRKIGTEGGKYLKKGASIYLEIGCDQAEAVTALLERQGFADVRTVRDAAGLDRVVAARWP